MEQIIQQLTDISASLHSMNGSAVPHELISAVAGGLIAAIAALSATKLSALFSKHDIERFTVVSLRAEVTQIRERLNNFLAQENAYNFTAVPFLASPERSCPVYMASGSHIGSLKIGVAEPIIRFYGALLTVRPRTTVPPTPDTFLSAELHKVVADADACLGALEKEYPKLAERK
jgi:hypothetical protein